MGKRRTKHLLTNPDRVTRVVAYARVSTSEQATEGVSIDAQRAAVTSYAQLHGLHLVAIVEDAGISASIPLAERPGGAQVVAMLDRGEVGAVLAIKLDRLFRDALDALAVTRAWDGAGVALHLIDLRVDTSSALGRLFLTMIAAVAEMERNLISERTSAALAHLKAQGVRIGRDGLGWSRIDERDDAGRLIVTEVAGERRTVEAIVSMRQGGLTYAEIASALTARGVGTKRGGRWHSTTVRNVALRAQLAVGT